MYFVLEFKQMYILGYSTNFKNKRRPKEKYNDTKACDKESAHCKRTTQFSMKIGVPTMSLPSRN